MRVCHPEARRCRAISRWVVRHTRYLARSFKFVGSPTLRSDDSENQSTSRAALTLRVRSFSFFPSRQGSSVVEQGTHKPLVGSSTLPPGTPLLFRLGNIWLQVFLAAAHRRHEAHSAVFGHCAGPAFLMDIAPSGKPQHRAGFYIPLRGKKKGKR